MRNLLLWTVVAALCSIPLGAAAHTGGPLDPDGCHADHRTGNFHCHRGAAAGYTFPNKPAMEEAVRTGKFPDKDESVDEEGFFERLWPFGNHHEQEEAGEDKDKAEGAASSTATAASGQSAAVPEKQREFEQRLKVLQGLYEMGLITKDEYEAKRKAVLDQL